MPPPLGWWPVQRPNNNLVCVKTATKLDKKLKQDMENFLTEFLKQVGRHGQDNLERRLGRNSWQETTMSSPGGPTEGPASPAVLRISYAFGPCLLPTCSQCLESEAGRTKDVFKWPAAGDPSLMQELGQPHFAQKKMLCYCKALANTEAPAFLSSPSLSGNQHVETLPLVNQ